MIFRDFTNSLVLESMHRVNNKASVVEYMYTYLLTNLWVKGQGHYVISLAEGRNMTSYPYAQVVSQWH